MHKSSPLQVSNYQHPMRYHQELLDTSIIRARGHVPPSAV